MILAWLKKPNLTVEVSGADIVVTLPVRAAESLTPNPRITSLSPVLFSSSRVSEEKRKISFPQFLALAWRAANDRAKEIGWIA